jgi:hypothetical protein
MITVYVKVKNVYGTEKVYPDCPITEIFAELTKTKTLSDNDLSNIIKLGYVIKTRAVLKVIDNTLSSPRAYSVTFEE